MSTLRVDQLQGIPAGRPPLFAKGTTVKAWHHIDSSVNPAVFRGSMNFSTLVDSAVGYYGLWFTAVMQSGATWGAIPAARLIVNASNAGQQITARNAANFEERNFEGAAGQDVPNVLANVWGTLA